MRKRVVVFTPERNYIQMVKKTETIVARNSVPSELGTDVPDSSGKEPVVDDIQKEDEKPDKKKDTPSVSDGEKKDDQTILTPLEDYIKTASYLGTKVITPTMRKYVYRRRLDGLAILNTLLVDKKLAEGIDFVKQYAPDEWTLVCKREAGWRAAKMFAELTGVRTFTKKYPSGVLTNTVLDNFIETKMVMICDPWLDKNALADAKNIRIPVAGICDTNNHTSNVDVVMIGNNKSNKSMGLFFWLLAKEYMKVHKIDKPVPSLEDFVGEELILEEPRKKKAAREKKEASLKSGESAIEEKMRELAEKADSEAVGGVGVGGMGVSDVDGENAMEELAKKADEEVKLELSDEGGESVSVGEGAAEGV